MRQKIFCALLAAALFLLCSATAEEGSRKGTRENPYRLDETCAFVAEILEDGSPRTDASQTDYLSVAFAIRLENFLTPDYFSDHYARQYVLSGAEAAAQIALRNGSEQAVAPQNAFWITFEDEAGGQYAGYQLVDAEVLGHSDILLEPGKDQVLYKHVDYTAGLKYLVLTYASGGERISRYFLLETRKVYPELAEGDRGEVVTELQQRLIDLGYLQGDADGIFGADTLAAVDAARAAAGLAQTGVADDAFQHLLFAADFPAAQ